MILAHASSTKHACINACTITHTYTHNHTHVTQVDGSSQIVHVKKEPGGTRLAIDASTLTHAQTYKHTCVTQVDGSSHIVHVKEEPGGTRLAIDASTCLLEAEADPSRLISASPGVFVCVAFANMSLFERVSAIHLCASRLCQGKMHTSL